MSADFKLSKKEFWFILALWLGVAFLTSFSFIYGWFTAPAGFELSGLRSWGGGDYYVYFSYIEQVKQGHWLFSDLYTPGSPYNVFNPFWLAIGLFAKVFSLAPALAFHLARVFFIGPFLYTSFVFLRYFFPEKNIKYSGMFFLLFASGWGGWSVLWQNGSVYFDPRGLSLWYDLSVTEAVTWLSLLYSPHFIWSLSLFTAAMLFVLRAHEKDHLVDYILGGVAALLLFSFHPYHILTLGVLMVVILGHGIWIKYHFSWKGIKRFVLPFLIMSPAVGYYCYLLFFNDVFQGKAEQNICALSTNPIMFVGAYGTLLLGAILAGMDIFQKRKHTTGENYRFKLIFICLIVQSIIFLLPLNINRRLLQNWQFPLVVLNLYVLIQVWGAITCKIKVTLRSKVIFVAIIFLLYGMTNFVVMARDFSVFRGSVIGQPDKFQPEISAYNSTVYIPSARGSLWNYLRANVAPMDVIMVSRGYVYGIAVPAETGRFVFLGHSDESVNSERRKQEEDLFFSSLITNSWRKDFLAQEKITYVVLFDKDEALMNIFSQDNFLQPVFSTSEAVVYRVAF